MERIVRSPSRESFPRYYDHRFKTEIVKIKAGEYFATIRPVIIGTLLGSCVAACIRDVVRGGGGMNHFMLPPPAGDSAPPDWEVRSLRYGGYAMECLINEFVKRGAQRSDLEAKVFGGAAVVPMMNAAVGDTNAAFVREYLAAEGIRTVAADLGGNLPRKLLFSVRTGRAGVQYLPRLVDEPIRREEVAYAQRVFHAAEPVEPELF